MNSENFHEYVKNPSMLHQVSYQELKSLVLQYPYSPNLRQLLLVKSIFDQTKDSDKQQVMASLASPDRKKLRLLVKQYNRIREMQENYALNEEFLELKDLSALEPLMEEPPIENLAPLQENKMVEAIPTPAPIPIAEEIDEEIEEESDLSFLSGLRKEVVEAVQTEEIQDAVPAVEEGPAPEPVEEVATETMDEPAQAEPTPEQDSAPVAHADIPLEITNEPDPQPKPMPRSSFNTWLKQLTPPKAGLLQGELKDISLNNRPHHAALPEQAPVPAAPPEEAKQMAEHSVEEDQEIVSVTLAVLLEKQKLYGKAISMYERLKLKFPEKSSLFAAKIEELSKKLGA